MKIRNKHLSVAAVATMFAIAGPGVAIATEGGSPGSSAAEINLSDCMLESSKDISYVEYLADGSTVTKDESIDAETLDLSTVEGIEDVDEVTVKAGTTVESFGVSCTGEDAEMPSEGDDEAGEAEDGDSEDGTEDGTEEGTYPWSGKANYRSTATISLTDCMLESSKDISYVAFLDDGSMVTKDESVDAETFDLSTVEGIEDFDAVQVKAGTTVESFALACSQDEAAPVESTPEESETEDQTEESGTEDGEAEAERGHDEAKHQEMHQARVSENHDEAKHEEKHRAGVQSTEEESDEETDADEQEADEVESEDADEQEADEVESEDGDDHEADDDHEVEETDEHDD